MNKNIHVSIVVPIYNVERYLEQCLESLHFQTLKEIEVICVDDGSTDGSPAIVERFVGIDPRFKVIRKKNSGYGNSVNVGIAQAVGEYVGIVESDDFVELNMFERLYEAAKKFDVDVVKSNFYFYWSTQNKKVKSTKMIQSFQANRILHPVADRFVFEYQPTVWSAIYRRDFLTKNDISFLETPGASYQDLGFSFKVWATAASAVLLEDAFVYYRQDNETSSINNKAKIYCVCDEYREMENFVDRHQALPRDLFFLISKLKFASYSWNLRRIAKPYRWEFLKQMSKEYRDLLRKRRFIPAEYSLLFKVRLYLIAYAPRIFFMIKSLKSSFGVGV